MNTIITLQYRTRAPDGMMGFTTVWTDLKTVWAKAWTVSSSETGKDQSINMVRTQKFQIAFRNLMRGTWRVKYGERYFDITGIDPDKKRESIFLTCKEVVK